MILKFQIYENRISLYRILNSHDSVKRMPNDPSNTDFIETRIFWDILYYNYTSKLF